MNLADFTLGFAVGWGSLMAIGRWLYLRDKAKAGKPAEWTPPQPSSAWRPLPGNRIVLADTGFEIAMVSEGDGLRPFRLFTPEGGLLAWGGDLAGLKTFAELKAAERAEFVPAAGWKP